MQVECTGPQFGSCIAGLSAQDWQSINAMLSMWGAGHSFLQVRLTLLGDFAFSPGQSHGPGVCHEADALQRRSQCKHQPCAILA